MDARQSLLVNDYEVATDEALREAAQRVGFRVCPKVRIADAVKIERSGLAPHEFSYALRAHFDFLVVREAHGDAEFAVEFDGPKHDTDPDTILRDRVKESICKRLGLPLLRIDASFLRRITPRYTVVGWLLEFWRLQEAFYAAQDRGEIAWVEPFCYFSVFQPLEGERGHESFGLDGPGRRLLMAAFRDEITTNFSPEIVSRTTEDNRGFYLAYALVGLRDGRILIGHAQCRSIGLSGILGWELADDLAVADLAEKVRRHRRGEDVAIGHEELRSFRRRTEGWECHGVPLPG